MSNKTRVGRSTHELAKVINRERRAFDPATPEADDMGIGQEISKNRSKPTM